VIQRLRINWRLSACPVGRTASLSPAAVVVVDVGPKGPAWTMALAIVVVVTVGLWGTWSWNHIRARISSAAMMR